MSDDTVTAIDDATHRRLAVDLFNGTWRLLDLDERTPEQVDELIHTAHASRYHWSQVGTPAHAARGEWQCARVYSTLGRAEPALWHARRCLALAEVSGEGFEDWDLASAHEGMARALLVAGERDEAVHHARSAREVLVRVGDDEDSHVIALDLDALDLG